MTVPTSTTHFAALPFRAVRDLELMRHFNAERRFEMEVVASVLPFRVNSYVLDELIDWSAPDEDPMVQLLFPSRDMLEPQYFAEIATLLRTGADRREVHSAATRIRSTLNPQPAGQATLNVPRAADGTPVAGVQHKYANTVLFFPSAGQTCHSYCTFCFRWPQFVGHPDRFAAAEVSGLVKYLRRHEEVTDLLITGGDPLVMRAHRIEAIVEPILTDPLLEHVRTIRIGTKALTFWPHRFLRDEDADDLLRLFERVAMAGRHLALQAHVDHWREMEPPYFAEATRRVRDTGAMIRAQGPLLCHVNDSAEAWTRTWEREVALGIVPYYLFVERDTGARRYFEVPLECAARIYTEAIRHVSGLARTVRGPSMSAGPGKIEVQGVTEVAGERVFVLRFLQARDPSWVNRPFFAKHDPSVTWFDGLTPAFGEPSFFFTDSYRAMQEEN